MIMFQMLLATTDPQAMVELRRVCTARLLTLQQERGCGRCETEWMHRLHRGIAVLGSESSVVGT